ncbi:carbohydrate ABC transporter permease [Aestuariimicrobium ganziense]|uniref:carbohydrate ABC transporter permease n=1 Tax=Aestuariimicrobium ganziense TaxID=2773677 RepID=UPI001941DAB4|nr:sugar ABC transporter permease [Aestuariimicrobium ganziense]
MWGWLLTLPALIHTLIWVGAPVVVAIFMSFTDYDVVNPPEFNGGANYTELMGDQVFWRALWHNLIMVTFGVPISMFIALVLAVALNQALRGQSWFRTMIFMPHVTATVAIAMIWLWIYAPGTPGLANRILSFVGLGPFNWLTSTDLALPAVILVTIWQGIGIKMLIYLAALQGVSHELYEAAEVDGANTIQKFFQITVPLLRPATFFVLVTSIIGNFQTFDLIFNLTNGGPANATTVITYQIYVAAFQQFRMGYATAMSVILLLVLLVLTLLSRKIVGGTDGE